MLVRRSSLPKGCSRGSLRIFRTGPSTSFSTRISSWYRCAPSTIVRNLKRRKRRPPRPTRSCKKNGEPGETQTMPSIAAAISGEDTISAAPATARSIPRLIACHAAGTCRLPLAAERCAACGLVRADCTLRASTRWRVAIFRQPGSRRVRTRARSRPGRDARRVRPWARIRACGRCPVPSGRTRDRR